jgi:hypothetical protein
MTREELATASDLLESAAESTDDTDIADRLGDLADQLDTLAERERAPDHGRLARIENALGELREDADEATVATIDDAEDEIVAFRETIEGV